MNRPRSSLNHKILRNILSKTRQIDVSQDVSYLIVYSFLYKYCSDLLKEYFLTVIEDKAITLDEAYKNGQSMELLRQDAFEMFGYFIKSPDFFIDEVINNSYSERFFIHTFFKAFSENVEFPEGSNYEKYFNFIFESVTKQINLKRFEFEGENHLIVKDIIYSISRLDVQERCYPFERVFDKMCQSKLMDVDHDPDYITSMLSSLVSSIKPKTENAYNPFLRDASALIDLKKYYEWGIGPVYGKGLDRITFCSSIVKLYLNNFDLDSVFLEFGSPFESVEIGSTSFDVILSRIPPITPKNLKRMKRAQNIEMAKRNKRKQLEDVLTSRFDMDEKSFVDDDELNDALENLLSKMNLERESEIEFTGEFESLRDSEYLFLINLINCLDSDGVMAVGMSQGFLFKNSLETLRKYLTVAKNYIDAIISIPDGLSRPNRSEIIVIFRKNKSTDDIVFIDTSNDYDTKRSPYSVPGLFKRNLVLDNETVNRVIDAYVKRRNVERFSNVVKLSEIEKNEFNLAISRYVDTFEGEFITLRELKHQKEDMESNLRDLNRKIDMMMDELNIRF